MTIRQVREKYKVTQKELGDIIGVTESAVCHMESGDYGIRVEHAKKIAKFFGFDWTKFFPDKE